MTHLTPFRIPVTIKFTNAWTVPEEHDKSTWGDGPWQTEPDKVVWEDPITGLDCMIHRNPVGSLCGYVGVDRRHPFYGHGYDDYDEPDCGTGHLSVHGGLTYADACQTNGRPEFGICHVPQPGRPHDVWWFGFDCAHAGDLCPKTESMMSSHGLETLMASTYGYSYKPIEYVVRECAQLASQLAAAALAPRSRRAAFKRRRFGR